ncbi:MAG: glycosyltransferase family 4 protein [Elusimicrobia bacterium]|nr:glycosyltransferase family 4 protein [Elusimicrobiota bacterium]
MVRIAERPGLALAFTPGVTLDDWRRSGFLSREVQYYTALGARVGRVVFVTQGVRDHELAGALGEIELVENSARLPSWAFWLTVPLRLRRLRPRPAILKTNQLAGVLAPLAAKVLRSSRIVARGGYVPSEPWWHRHHWDPRRVETTIREAVLCWLADLVLVSSEESAAYVQRRYRLPVGRVRIVPNFVDIARFRVTAPKVHGLVTMVGRLVPQKNVLAAIEAVASIPGARLRLIGDGPLRAAVERRANETGASVEILGVVEHRRLPELLAASEIYLMASLYEGHPKTLIEAMAVGLACVAVPSPGVTSVVEHGETGYLSSGPDAHALRTALMAVLADAGLRERLGTSARLAAARYSLERVLDLECEAYRSVGWIP